MITVQAAVSAILVATLYFPGETSGVSRMVDGLIGGSAALAVVALLPADPLNVVHREASRVLGELAGTLHGVSEALEARNSEAVTAVLARARNTQLLVDDLERALRTGDEIAASAHPLGSKGSAGAVSPPHAARRLCAAQRPGVDSPRSARVARR